MVTDEAYNAVNNYFSMLTHTGYVPDEKVNKLIAFTFMEEMLYGSLSDFMDEEDYDTIMNGAECLYGSCMIPYPDYKDSYDEVVNRMFSELRVTEDLVIRETSGSNLRSKS